MANIKAESNTSRKLLLTSQKLRDPLTDVFANLSVESLLNLRLTNKHLQTAVDNFVIQKLKQEFPGELESLGENTINGKILHLYTTLIECKEYFSKLSNSDSDKILKTHCLAYLICKYPSNTKAKGYFIENGADLKAAEELLQSLKKKSKTELNSFLENTFTWDSLYLLKTFLLLGADFGCALRREARAGKTERVKLLLAADKQTEAVNAKNQDDYTALMEAARHGYTETVKALLAHNKIEVNATDNGGWTALTMSVIEGKTRTVQMLLAHNEIDINAKNINGETALMWAARDRYTGVDKALLAHNEIDINAKNNHGETALMYAAHKGHTNAVKALLTHNNIDDINAKCNNGQTALMRAANKGRTETVAALLAHSNIDVNTKDKDGWTALIGAAQEGHEETVKALLAHSNIDVNAEDNDGHTALIWAAQEGHIETVAALLAHSNIDVNTKDKDGWTPLIRAMMNRQTVIINLLETHIDNKAQESQIKTQNTKKSLFSGALTASLFAAIAATVSYGLKLPLFTILGSPLVLIALAAVAGFIVGAGLAVAIIAYSNKNAMVESTDNRTHRESTPKVSSNNTVINGFSAGKNVETGVANGQVQNTEQRFFLGCNIV